jgi:hypothetical protein
MLFAACWGFLIGVAVTNQPEKAIKISRPAQLIPEIDGKPINDLCWCSNERGGWWCHPDLTCHIEDQPK